MLPDGAPRLTWTLYTTQLSAPEVDGVSDVDQRDARLEIECADALLTARFTSGADLVEAQRPYDRDDVARIARDIAAIAGRGTRWGDDDQGSRELLRQHGALLFDAVLPGPVKSRLRAAVGRAVRLTLVVDEALAALPWELMHTGAAFVGLDFALGRIVRGLQAESQVGAPCARADRTLIVCDPRGDLMGSYYEGLTLRDELLQAGVAVDLRSTEVALAEVRRVLREYDVVHFAGHAELGGGDERGWWLADGVFGPTAIAELAGGRSFPRLVFSNACRSAGPELARAFLAAGVEHYIGTIQEVPDEPASLFAVTFHAALRAHAELGIAEAVRVARVALAERYGDASVHWAAWVLYGLPGTGTEAIRWQREAPVARGASAVTGVAELGARVRGAAVAQLLVPSRPLAKRANVLFALGLTGLAAAVIASLSVSRAPTAPGMVLEGDGALGYRVDVEVLDDGYFGVWHIDDVGRVRRVDVAHGPLRPIDGGDVVQLPGDGATLWFDVGDRLVLAWREVPPHDARELDAELERAMVGPRFDEVLVDQFDVVTELVVKSQQMR